MATADQLNKSIEPGSIPQGQRGPLVENLGELAGGGGAQAAQPAGGGPGTGMPSAGNPLGALISGEVNPGDQNTPLTDGISVGPGQGGASDVPDSQQQRLALLAQGSRSPQIRSAARLALLRYDQEKRL